MVQNVEDVFMAEMTEPTLIAPLCMYKKFLVAFSYSPNPWLIVPLDTQFLTMALLVSR